MVSLKDYLMDTINERDHKYEQRFLATDKVIADLSVTIKEALATALTSTKDALDTATRNTKDALMTASASIAKVEQQQDQLARKSEIIQELASVRKQLEELRTAAVNHAQFDTSTAMKLEGCIANQQAFRDEAKQAILNAGLAVTKAEASTERRFESVNEFRKTQEDRDRNDTSRWQRVEATLMPRSEAEVIFQGLNEKYETLRTAQLHAASASGGMREGWGIAIGVVMFIIAVVSVIFALLKS
jgi:hypothetical protein